MAVPAPTRLGDGPDQPKGLAKLLKKARSLFKRVKSKRQSRSDTHAPPVDKDSETSTFPGPTTSPNAIVPLAVPAVSGPEQTSMTFITPGVVQKSEPGPTAPGAPASVSVMSTVEYSHILQEKSRAIFAKYDMVLEPDEWTPPLKGEVVRVEKKVRMRIHRTCHRCHTTIGADRVCTYCEHRRCKKCPRYPSLRNKGEKSKCAARGSHFVNDRL